MEVVAVLLSSVEHDPMNDTKPIIKSYPNNYLFHNNFFHYRKMQDYSYHLCIGYSVNQHRNYSPSSFNLKQSKNAPGTVYQESIFLLKAEYNTFFCKSCLFRFASVKSAITGFLRRISKVKTVNIEALG